MRRTIQKQTLRVKHNMISTRCQDVGNIPGCLQPSQLKESLILLDCIANQLCGSGLSLRSDNDRLLLLDGLVDLECGSQGSLLSDLEGIG